MNISHIITTFSPEHGGPTREIGDYCLGQADLNYKVNLYSTSGFPNTSLPRVLGPTINEKSFPLVGPPSFGFSSKLIKQISRDPPPDVFHIHGMWHLTQALSCNVAKKLKVPYVYHLMGAFNEYELKRKAFKKYFALMFYQNNALRSADIIHVNSESESIFLRSLGFRNEILSLPVGVSAKVQDVVSNDLVPRLSSATKSYKFLLFLARVHPTKGVDILLNSWSQLAADFPSHILLVAGGGDSGYLQELGHLSQSLGIQDRVMFVGHVSEVEKTWLFQNALGYILPSYHENFGNSIAEALSFGLPVITTNRTPWLNLTELGCGWVAEPSQEDLVPKIEQLLSLSDEGLAAMGLVGRVHAIENFSIDASLEKLDTAYKSILR